MSYVTILANFKVAKTAENGIEGYPQNGMIIKNSIETKLREAFQPDYLEVRDDSHQHRSGAGAQSHFRVTLVSRHFQGQRLLLRHKAVNHVLAQELAGPVHALALHVYVPEEWADTERAPEPPPCMSNATKAAAPGALTGDR